MTVDFSSAAMEEEIFPSAERKKNQLQILYHSIHSYNIHSSLHVPRTALGTGNTGN